MGVNLLSSTGARVLSPSSYREDAISQQAANGTLSLDQRDALSQELQSISTEIDNISQTVEFNGQILLDGSLAP
jgi:flagellin